MRIPFTNYELNLKKRSVFVQNGSGPAMSFVNWLRTNNIASASKTPVLNNIYKAIASEFAKVDLKHVKYRNGQLTECDDSLDYLVSERPNEYQSKFDYMFTMAYQYCANGQAFAFIQRDATGRVASFMPINSADYLMGNTYYQVDDSGWLYIKLKDKKGRIVPVRYDNIIHLRANPNNIFYGEAGSVLDNNAPIVRLFDTTLAKLLEELNQAGTIYGVVELGQASEGWSNAALASEEAKRKKQQEITERIRKSKGNILVLDAGEKWTSLNRPFDTTSTEQVSEYQKYLYEFNQVSQKVVNGTATFEEMEVFFNQRIVPILEQYVMECNYKVFTQSARSKGNRIEWYRNPFEYLPIDKAIDVAYKGAMDTTTNERRRMIYKLPPAKGGDVLMENKNFRQVLSQNEEGGSQEDETNEDA